MSKKIVDFLVIGGGVIGICVARELKSRYRNASVIIVDKESNLGKHASGRNSGVIHAGFYYTEDSLKARFCREGSEALKRYIFESKLKINPCGKLVVAQSESELPYLAELKRRGDRNGVDLELVSATDAKKIEPRVKTFEKALWSPNTATADPIEVINRFRADAIGAGIEILFEHPYVRYKKDIVRVGNLDVSAGFVVNCAGLYADRVAIDFGFSQNYRILPFKGLYLYSNEPPGQIKTNIYPVPDLRNPFLGVHFTVTVDGFLKIGPTAIPALWREQYDGLTGFQFGEFIEVAWRNLGLISHSGFEFHRLAFEEFQKYSKRRLVSLASQLIQGVDIKQFARWGRPGIRAQLLNTKTLKLEMDFVIEGDKKSIHVLNAISPAWTCSIPFAKHVCDRMEALQLT
jgi:L-2-hydroxyglutarate oxidase LhgO